MSDYNLTWITKSLAVGSAPMSFADLDFIKEHGVDAIVNLCGEYCDLHELEEKSGFEVYYIPIPDETAPDMAELEKGLQWLDEAIYLGKKVLVHCRHGIGRTGTFVTGYLVRRGLGLKMAEKKLKGSRAQASNYSQWQLLKKYGKKEGKLTIREPSLENSHLVDLGSFFSEYEALVGEIGNSSSATKEPPSGCGIDSSQGCFRYFELQLIEAVYLSHKINKVLTAKQRQQAVDQAVETNKVIRKLVRTNQINSREDLANLYLSKLLGCPLNVNEHCLIPNFRPLGCQLFGQSQARFSPEKIKDMLSATSRSVFLALTGVFPQENLFLVSCADTVSGRFAQIFFHYLASVNIDQ